MASKRLNFDVTPEQEAEISWLRDTIGTPTNKDTVLRAVRILSVLSAATQGGGQVFIRTAGGELQRLVVPELESPASEPTYLVFRPHAWRRQPWVKGSRVLAATLWRDLLTNGLTPGEVAESWGLPEEAVHEIVVWCEGHRELLELEALEERRRLTDQGVQVGAAPAR